MKITIYGWSIRLPTWLTTHDLKSKYLYSLRPE